LFNPNQTVVKVFVVLYDFSDMPPNFQTFLRQKTTSLVKSDGLVDGVRLGTFFHNVFSHNRTEHCVNFFWFYFRFMITCIILYIWGIYRPDDNTTTVMWTIHQYYI
jgi:hypothetical protein